MWKRRKTTTDRTTPAAHEAGRWGETVAAAYLKRKRFRILGRRVRVGTRDELDIVAREGDVLVFVEVKTRKSTEFGRPMAAVDRKKRHAQSRAAVRYLAALKKPVYFRFDVVEVIGERDGPPPKIHHIRNAFTLDTRYRLPF